MAAHAGSKIDSNGRRRSARRGVPGARQRFVAAIDELDGGTPVVSVMGEVDMATAPALEQALLDTADQRRGEVIVDLTGCNFLDSRGLTTLIEARERLECSNRPLGVVVSNPNVLMVFKITGFDRVFEIYPSLGAVGADGHG